MKRVVTPELLDEDLGTAEEIQRTLLDLRGLNRDFGGFSSMAAMLRIVAQHTRGTTLTFLDVAGGAGDIAENVVLDLGRDGIKVRPVVLDRAISHMNAHKLQQPRVAGDALALPFASSSVDVVGCNLFCHHLEADQIVRFLNEGLRVSRTAFIASDLRRNRFHLLAALAGRLVYRSRLTRNDAPASVRRAYTIDEIRSLAERTHAARVTIQPYYFQRFGLILWKDLV